MFHGSSRWIPIVYWNEYGTWKLLAKIGPETEFVHSRPSAERNPSAAIRDRLEVPAQICIACASVMSPGSKRPLLSALKGSSSGLTI